MDIENCFFVMRCLCGVRAPCQLEFRFAQIFRLQCWKRPSAWQYARMHFSLLVKPFPLVYGSCIVILQGYGAPSGLFMYPIKRILACSCIYTLYTYAYRRCIHMWLCCFGCCSRKVCTAPNLCSYDLLCMLMLVL